MSIVAPVFQRLDPPGQLQLDVVNCHHDRVVHPVCLSACCARLSRRPGLSHIGLGAEHLRHQLGVGHTAEVCALLTAPLRLLGQLRGRERIEQRGGDNGLRRVLGLDIAPRSHAVNGCAGLGVGIGDKSPHPSLGLAVIDIVGVEFLGIIAVGLFQIRVDIGVGPVIKCVVASIYRTGADDAAAQQQADAQKCRQDSFPTHNGSPSFSCVTVWDALQDFYTVQREKAR